MNKYEPTTKGDLIFAVFVMAGFVIAILISIFAGYQIGFESGQTEAANGRFHFHLATLSDGSTRWMKSSEPTTMPAPGVKDER